MVKRIFVTGASGCIGHYLAEALIQLTPHDLFFLVRDINKLKFDYNARPGITVIEGDMREIDHFADLLKTIDCAILTATSWGGAAEVFDVNVTKTMRLMSLLDPDRCEQVLYFSTASILDRQNQPLKQAGEIGTDYIRSKYICYSQLSRLPIASKVTVLFPTLVFGGDDQKPLSHLTSGIREVLRWAGLIRFFKADAGFHFLHARDIAQVTVHLVDHPLPVERSRDVVLGNGAMTVNQAIEEVCDYLHQPILFRIPLSVQLANFFIKVFRIQMAAWDRFCMQYRHFTYSDPVNPSTFGLSTYCPTLADVLKVSGVPPR
ncbi:NAD-dependent epimerase/dehydratase family protein [Leptolyngbya ohadii]|uniref:NAD-dependent epimerase/dehydratase family protein n=1 Tax=Leptolyngbya ohadii TaxID=1962290 RepID=UPI000B59C1D7|nr:NAD(P)-dependent oxidoreductase [Leptolyngbya ohadii]